MGGASVFGLAWLCAALLLPGCGGDAAVAETAPVVGMPDTLVVSADPELRARVAELLPGLARRAGLPLLRPIRVEWRSRDELEDYLLARLEEELPVDEAAFLTRSYSLLGLVPEALDLRALLVDVYREQVAGFYDPDSLTLWIMDDQPDATVQTVLLHELVHAVQDQAASLDSITAKSLGSDRRTAAQAAIEGHATLVMIEEMMERGRGQPVDLTQVPGLAESLVPSPEEIEAQYPALADAPRVIQESLLFPYVAGAGFVLELWRQSGGRPAPLGDALPQSTEHILHPETFLGNPRDEPTPVVVESAQASVFEDELGQLGLGVFLEEALGPGAKDGAQGWAGDRFALFESDTSEGLAWFVLWDSAEARDRFAAAVRQSGWARRSEAVIEPLIVGDHSAVRITIGTVPEVTARVGS